MPKKIKVIVAENGKEVEKEIEVPDGPELSWGDTKAYKYMNQEPGVIRKDALAKVTGRAKYGSDINRPGLLHGRILRSPHARAELTKIDASAAEKMKGVAKVTITASPGTQLLFQGQEIGAVAAETPEIAEDAIRAIKAEYKVLPHIVKEEDGVRPGAPQIVPNEPTASDPRTSQRGDVEAGFEAAKATSEGTYGVPVIDHCCLETHGCTVVPGDDVVTVYPSTQHAFGWAGELAGVVKQDGKERKVESICEYMGGGFGSKFGAGYEGQMAARLAMATGRPVKMFLTRSDEHLAAGNAPSAFVTVKLGADVEGKLTAIQSSGYGTGGLGGAGINLPYMYQIPNRDHRFVSVKTNANPERAFRAPSRPQHSWIMELAMNEMAAKIGMDPLEFRLKNDQDERRRRQWQMGAEAFKWKESWKPTGSQKGRFRRGVGCAGGEWGSGGSPGNRARVIIGRDGSVTIQSGSQDLGTGTRSAQAIVVADELGIPYEAVVSELGHSSWGPGTGSGGSTTIASLMPVVKSAANNARIELAATVASAIGAKPEDVVFADGRVFNKVDPSKSLTWKSACARLGMNGIAAEGQFVNSLQQGGQRGVQFCEVEVDAETGRIRPIRFLAVQDCGIPVNREGVRSQVRGAVIMGITMALCEERVLDRVTGRMLNDDLEFYKLAGPMEIPPIEVIIDDYGAKGVSGVAEPANIPPSSAVACAVHNALGVAVRQSPMTPKRVLDALHGGRQA